MIDIDLSEMITPFMNETFLNGTKNNTQLINQLNFQFFSSLIYKLNHGKLDKQTQIIYW